MENSEHRARDYAESVIRESLRYEEQRKREAQYLSDLIASIESDLRWRFYNA